MMNRNKKTELINNLAGSLEKQFSTPCPTALEVATTYFGIHNEDTIRNKAAKQELPIPAFRLASTQKGSFHINVYDLAEYIICIAETAKKDHTALKLAAL